MQNCDEKNVMPRCIAAMGILGGVSKMCYLVEDSLRHLRCRGMTSQGFPLAMPILTCVRWHDVTRTHDRKVELLGGMTREIQDYGDKIFVSSSRLGKVSKLPLLLLRSVGSKFKIDSSVRHSTFWSVSEFPHVMPRCTAAMGILGEVSKMCYLV